MKEAMFGAILLGCWVISLLFFRFWRRHRERLFWWFGAAFCLLAVERALLLAVPAGTEYEPTIYVCRLLAFVFILYAIYRKNRAE